MRARSAQLSDDLIAGRWALSAEQVDYFAERLQIRLGEVVSPAALTVYVRQFDLARALQERFRLQGSIRPGDVVPYALIGSDEVYQTFYTPAPPGAGADSFLGMVVNFDWVQHTLLEEVRAESALDRSLDSGVELTRVAASHASSDTRVAFKAIFPFWELTLRPASRPTGPWPGRDVTIFAGSILLILSVLMMGVVFLVRDVSRDAEVNRLRTDFVSGVSHELKTPLTLISLYAETLLDDERFHRDERRSFYEIIMRESERLTHLIDNVLEFSRIDRGQKEYHLRVGDLGAVIARTVDAYGQYLRRRGFSVEANLVSPLAPVRFDADAVTQALLNLLDNASKYSADGKFIGVSLRAIDASVVLEVEDHGPGVPTAEQRRIFEQFYRSAEDSGRGGYGLGLFLVNHIMQAHGGRVELESEPGRGSRFRLIFPCTRS